MGDLVFLSHRIPYPPDKGEKIRAYQLLRSLAAEHRIHLAAFVDDPYDVARAHELRPLCHDMLLVRQRPLVERLASLRALLSFEPLTLRYYYSRRIARWVAAKAAGGIRQWFVYSSAMAPYVRNFTDHARVVDMVDVDSEKWRQYAEASLWPMSYVYGREARTLGRFEHDIAAEFDAAFFVSVAEREFFLNSAPDCADRVMALPNGVDTEYFDPGHAFDAPYTSSGPVIVFTGAMSYRPNVDAVTWFADEIFPAIRERFPDARFCIVGINPAPAVVRLGQRTGIDVTGRVADVRPYLAHGAVAVAPMRIARGVQNKVLEAMAMSRAVVSTSAGLEGIGAEGGRDVVIADTTEAFVDAVTRLLGSAEYRHTIGTAARAYVQRSHSWRSTGDALLHMLARTADERSIGSSSLAGVANG